MWRYIQVQKEALKNVIKCGFKSFLCNATRIPELFAKASVLLVY